MRGGLGQAGHRRQGEKIANELDPEGSRQIDLEITEQRFARRRGNVGQKRRERRIALVLKADVDPTRDVNLDNGGCGRARAPLGHGEKLGAHIGVRQFRFGENGGGAIVIPFVKSEAAALERNLGFARDEVVEQRVRFARIELEDSAPCLARAVRVVGACRGGAFREDQAERRRAEHANQRPLLHRSSLSA